MPIMVFHHVIINRLIASALPTDALLSSGPDGYKRAGAVCFQGKKA
jgi:hypothetical protein